MFAWRVLAPALLSAGCLLRGTGDSACLGQEAKPTPAGRRIEEILATPVTWDYVETPLRAILHQVQTEHKIDIRLDHLLDNPAGPRIDQPVTRRFQGISLKAALRWTLRDLDMTYVVEGNSLRPIPAAEAADWQLATQLYPIGDLLRSGLDGETLIQAITTWVAAQGNGSRGLGMIARILPEQPEVLVVEQPLRAQARIAGLLETLRRVVRAMPEQEPPLADRLALPAWERKIFDALDSPTEMAFVERALDDVVAKLKKRHQIEIQLDQKALDEVGIGTDTPITRHLTGLSLRDALQLLLRDLDLTCVAEDEILLITTPEEADTHWSTHLYRIDGLFPSQERQTQTEALLKALTLLVDPGSWSEAGGKGAAAIVRLRGLDALVVEQSWLVHEKVFTLLAQARMADSAPTDDRPLTVPAHEAKILDALDKPTQLEFIETPLQDVIDSLKDYHGIEIQIDQKCLDDVGIGTDTLITRALKGISLRSALRLLLDDLDLTYTVQDGVLLITTPEEAETQWSTQLYSLADLLPAADRPDAAQRREALLRAVSLGAPLESWREAGGEGAMAVVPLRGGEVLAVRQTWPAHETILGVLQQLRRVAQAKGPERGNAYNVVLARSRPEHKVIDALGQPTSIEFIQTPLQDVVDFLKEFHAIEIQCDLKGLDDVGLGIDAPITQNLKDMSLSTALQRMLDGLKLTHIVRDEVLLITTPKRAAEHHVTQLYLLQWRQKADSATSEAESKDLLAKLKAAVASHSWEPEGWGRAEVVLLDNAAVLVVTQSPPVQQRVAHWLTTVER